MSEASAGNHGNRKTGCRHERTQDKGNFISHSPGAVLIGNKLRQMRKIHCFARCEHGIHHRQNFLIGHTVFVNRLQPAGHRFMADEAGAVVVNERSYPGRGIRFAFKFFGCERVQIHDSSLFLKNLKDDGRRNNFFSFEATKQR